MIDYIEKNIDHEFTLDELARIACFSKYHFHRIFSSIMNETLFDFIQRSRVERAASLLLTNKEAAVTTIAHACGFSSHALFTRTFNKYFGMSPTRWRKLKSKNDQTNSNVVQEECNQRKELNYRNVYVEYTENTNYWRFSMNTRHQTVEVKELPDMTVAYVRHVGPYKGDEALFGSLFGKLCTWAGPRNLIGKDAKFLTVYHDDYKITKENKLRISVSLVVPPNTEISGEIGKMIIAGGKYALSRFVLSKDEFVQAWDWIYGTWLPQSGYQPDDKPCFELFPEEPKNGKYTVDIYAPVKPL
ncbi:MAG TPA: GyrI-like domain-containing protein [Syntrophorhabdaceae bacterium]|nr:GyrI-like domain-containing protein [Syntrophorhabdaceae bacterium]